MTTELRIAGAAYLAWLACGLCDFIAHWRTDLPGNLQKVVETCKEQGFTIARLEDYLPQ